MKTNLVQISSFPVAAAAFALIPVSPFAATLVVTVAGVLSVLMLDYGHTRMPIAVPAQIIPFAAANQAPEATREAA
jgi:hypothetical protein